MGKKTVFTNITPLPPQVSREVAVAMLHNHDEMIELNPLVIEHHPIKTPRDASKDEFLDCAWQEMTDKIHYLPGGIVKGKVSYKGCFHDLPNGLQTHIYAPMSLDIREKWTICGSLPGEPEEAQELGLNAPRRGLYMKEECIMKCNLLMTNFVRKNLDNAHRVLVERILAKAERIQAHLNASAASSPQSGAPQSIPPFQAGSHMSTSSIVRQLSGSTMPLEEHSQRSIALRSSSSSTAIQSVRTPLQHEFVRELPTSTSDDLDRSRGRQPTVDEGTELASVHPAFREQYRQGRSSSGQAGSGTALPAYDTLEHQQGQFYHEDLAKRPAHRQFAAELEGSQGTLPVEALRTSRAASYDSSTHNSYQISEMGDSIPSARSAHHQTAFGEAGVMSEIPTPYHHHYSHAELNVPSHSRSYHQPLGEADTYISNASLSSRYSVVSGMSEMPTPKTEQYGFRNGVDNRFSVVSAMTEAPTPRFRQLSFGEQQKQVRQQNVF